MFSGPPWLTQKAISSALQSILRFTRHWPAATATDAILPSRQSEASPRRDAGVLEGKTGGDRIGKLSVEQAEIARRRRQLEVSEGKRKKTEDALDIMGKLSAFFENAINESQDEPKFKKK